jgi:hypothetical protein
MQFQHEIPDPPTNDSAPRTPIASQRAEVRRFLLTAILFLPGLLLAALALDRAIGIYLTRTRHHGGLGPEVQAAVDAANHGDAAVRVIFLGDSVAHQLFTPGAEPGPRVRFLTSNYAIAMAGQAYLGEAALRNDPNLTDIYLFQLPQSWENDLPRDLTHDYFCGYFHSARQVAEVFAVKRDIELSFAHLGRWLVPNVMAANSLSRPALALQPQALREGPGRTAAGAYRPDPERLLTEVSALFKPAAAPAPELGPGRRAVVLSSVSRYFLAKLRAECKLCRVRLHVLPCPVSNEKNLAEFIDVEKVYDGEIIGDIPADHVGDAVHLKRLFVVPMRARMIELYQLQCLRSGEGSGSVQK